MRTSSIHGLLAAFALATLGACGSSDSPGPTNPGNGGNNSTPPTPITGLAASATSSTAIRVQFVSRTSDNSYNLERAEGASGGFNQITVISAPAVVSTLTFNDANLKASTLYRYRVRAVANNLTSDPSAEASATTLISPSLIGTADITTDITANRTFFPETTYTLKGFIHVTNGATLTIRPGTKILGDFTTPGSSLFIMRGARIDAQGTAAQPIVFTSSRPAGSRQPGDWGGITIIGNGQINRSGSVAVEGTGTDGTVAGGRNYQILYSGGNTPTDNSGTMSYVRVEFAGYGPSADNELNAFTFAAVGSGTRISYLQAMASLDDAFEFLGGALDGDHLVAYESGDDMFDFSEGFSGRLQYLIGYNSLPIAPRAGAGVPSADITGIEADGCFGAGCGASFNSQPYTIPLVANFTLVGCGSNTTCGGTVGGTGLSLRRGTGGFYLNGVVARFPTAGISVRDQDTFVRAGAAATPNVNSSDLLMRNIYFTEFGLTVFQPAVAVPQNQYSFDLPTNALTAGVAISQSLFVAVPVPLSSPGDVTALDWTPNGTTISSGGSTIFTGRIITKAGTFVVPTSYLGAADPNGTKWWAGWTVYLRN
jgi:hypothetical protein